MRSFALPLFAAVLCGLASGQQQPERLGSEAEGYSFAVPKGFTGQASGEGFALVNAAKTVLIAVKSHGCRDFNAFAADANLQQDGLELAGEPQAIKGGTTFRTTKRTDQGLVVMDTSVVFMPAGGGVTVVAVSDQANSEAAFKVGIELAQSVRFERPNAVAADDRVRRMLAGKNLVYLYTGNGYSERKDILLCSSGRFFQSTDMGGFDSKDVDGPSFAASGGKTGSWEVSGGGTRLVLRFAGGGAVTFTLSARQASNEIGMNGQRFFVQAQNKCN